jgi:hypothetical protein
VIDFVVGQIRQRLPSLGFRAVTTEPPEQLPLPAFVVYLLDGVARPQARGRYTFRHVIAIDYMMPRNDPIRAYTTLSSVIDEVATALWQIWEDDKIANLVAIEELTYTLRAVEWGGVPVIAAHFALTVKEVPSSSSVLSS